MYYYVLICICRFYKYVQTIFRAKKPQVPIFTTIGEHFENHIYVKICINIYYYVLKCISIFYD